MRGDVLYGARQICRRQHKAMEASYEHHAADEMPAAIDDDLIDAIRS